ncbi:unnamed protein product [Parnassius apollo]|uniref:(apollo) hypothetical protein n=1 Tax=Parnassius apollo TaxID=110799 RepID=A0A8S3Y961_PARAO|nr:unnamed protein product [Parnassius apollo]
MLRIVRTVRMAFAGTNVSLSQSDITQKLTERVDNLKQRIAAWGKRIRRNTERSTRFNQNRRFQSDQKRLYESLERPMVSGTGPAPNQADTVIFWSGLSSEPVNHSESPWTKVVASQCASITPMDPVIITADDVAGAFRRAPNWKSPGLDGLHHYWLKGFVVCHTVLARQFQEALNQKSLPSLFTTGITHFVPKDPKIPPHPVSTDHIQNTNIHYECENYSSPGLKSDGEMVIFIGRCKCCLNDGDLKNLWTPYTFEGETEIYGMMLTECFALSWVTFGKEAVI